MDSSTVIRNIGKEIAKLPKKKIIPDEVEFLERYMGNNRKFLGAKTGDLVIIAKNVLRENLEIDELIEIMTKLFASKTFEEYIIGGKIFTFLKPEVRSQIPLTQLEKWLSKAKGWVEVDVICQSSFTSDEVLGRWDKWHKAIKQFSKSDAISLRRASLVLQNLSVRKTNDPKLRQLAFETVEQLKHEKDGLITKAVSWLLRSLSDQNKQEVKEYLKKNESTLPRIAFRETMKKIETGRKNGSSQK